MRYFLLSTLFPFNFFYHLTLSPNRHFLLSTLFLFSVLSHSTFALSTFFTIQHFVIWNFVPFDVFNFRRYYFGILSVNPKFLSNLSYSDSPVCPACSVPAALSCPPIRLSCAGCPFLAALYIWVSPAGCSVSSCPVLAVLSPLSCPSCLVPAWSPILLSCSDRSVLSVLSWLPGPHLAVLGCLVLAKFRNEDI